MSAVLEAPQVSQGFPVDGQMFEPPEINRDNEKPRYLTAIGSTITPDTVRSRPWTLGGGIEVSNPCLRVVKNFIRKGRITPLLKDTHDFLPFDLVRKTTEINPLQAGYFGQSIPRNYVPPSLPPANGQFQPGFGNIAVGGPSPYGNMVGKLALPGEQVRAILTGTENMSPDNVARGIVEHESLYGHDYRPQSFSDGTYLDPTIREIQFTIFPTFPNLPTLLDDLERLLDDATRHASLRLIVDDMQKSLGQFRDYATSTIHKVHNEMRESAGRGGYVYRYTAMDLVLLEQLGMDRQDRNIQRAVSVGSNGRLEEMFAAFLASQADEKSARAEADRRVAALIDGQAQISFTPPVDETTIMAAPPPEVAGDAGQPGQPGQEGTSGVSGASGQSGQALAVGQDQAEPTIEKFECVCGKSFTTQKGLITHETVHCEMAKAQRAGVTLDVK